MKRSVFNKMKDKYEARAKLASPAKVARVEPPPKAKPGPKRLSWDLQRKYQFLPRRKSEPAATPAAPPAPAGPPATDVRGVVVAVSAWAGPTDRHFVELRTARGAVLARVGAAIAADLVVGRRVRLTRMRAAAELVVVAGVARAGVNNASSNTIFASSDASRLFHKKM